MPREPAGAAYGFSSFFSKAINTRREEYRSHQLLESANSESSRLNLRQTKAAELNLDKAKEVSGEKVLIIFFPLV